MVEIEARTTGAEAFARSDQAHERAPERRDGEPLILRVVLITDLDVLGHVKSGATSLYVKMPVFRGDGVAFA
jgi:hypothetical protein